MLLTNLFKYSPIAHKWETENLEELIENRAELKRGKRQKSIAGSSTKNEKYKQYCIKYMKDNNLYASDDEYLETKVVISYIILFIQAYLEKKFVKLLISNKQKKFY